MSLMSDVFFIENKLNLRAVIFSLIATAILCLVVFRVVWYLMMAAPDDVLKNAVTECQGVRTQIQKATSLITTEDLDTWKAACIKQEQLNQQKAVVR